MYSQNAKRKMTQAVLRLFLLLPLFLKRVSFPDEAHADRENRFFRNQYLFLYDG